MFLDRKTGLSKISDSMCGEERTCYWNSFFIPGKRKICKVEICENSPNEVGVYFISVHH